VLSNRGQKVVESEGDFMPLPAHVLAEQQKRLDAAK
jgi:hypothetical protein